MAAHGKSHVQLITTPTVDSQGTCLILFFQDKRYIIGNLHEGFQRACVQRSIKLNKVSDIFLTGTTAWKNTGGMFGMILTLADVLHNSALSSAEQAKLARTKREQLLKQPGLPQKTLDRLQKEHQERMEKEELQGKAPKQRLTLHGGSNLLYTMATGRRFIFRKGMPLDINEIGQGSSHSEDWKPTYADEFIRAWAMPILPERLLNAKKPERVRSPSPFNSNHGANANEGSDFLRSVVSDMFDSDWRLDALFAVRLSEAGFANQIFVRNEETKKIEPYKGPRPGNGQKVPDIIVLIRKPWPGALVNDLPATARSEASMCYIIRNHPQRGKFMAARAKDLGVRPGPDFGKLANGVSVVSKDGKTIVPEQVLGKGKAGGGFAIVDLPSKDYILDLINRPEWSAESVMEGVESIIWNLGEGVANDKRLQDFIKQRDNMKHVISSPDYCPNYLSMDSASEATIRHHQVDPARFGIPKHDNKIHPLPAELASCTPAMRGLTVTLEPSVSVDQSDVVNPLNTALVLAGTPKDVLDLARLTKEEIETDGVQREIDSQNLPGAETEIITLGTGSSIPSKYRNVSATLVRVPGYGSYLLDCGEGTLGQLARIYSRQELVEVLRDLRMIWISHMHGDHHLGTTSVIKAWHEAVYGDKFLRSDKQRISSGKNPVHVARLLTEAQKLFIVAEPAMSTWLFEYARVEDYGYDKLVVLDTLPVKTGKHPHTRFMWGERLVGFNTPEKQIDNALCTATGLTDLSASYVKHCLGARAVAMTFQNGFKISYSGDCRPSKDFVKIGKGSTVLVHEATFDDDLAGDAKAKNHSTTSEAIGVGLAMGARRIVLTHFSQRYQKIPTMDLLRKQELELEDSTGEEEMAGIVDESKETQILNLSSMVEADANLNDILGSPQPSSEPQPEAEKVDISSQSLQKEVKFVVANDLMRIKVKDIYVIERFTPALLKLYEETEKTIASEETTSLSGDNSSGSRKRARSAEAPQSRTEQLSEQQERKKAEKKQRKKEIAKARKESKEEITEPQASSN